MKKWLGAATVALALTAFGGTAIAQQQTPSQEAQQEQTTPQKEGCRNSQQQSAGASEV